LKKFSKILKKLNSKQESPLPLNGKRGGRRGDFSENYQEGTNA
jgi:hypothetical protein